MLSIIVVGRNDDFGGNFVKRLLSTSLVNSRELVRRRIPHQFCFVEWNSSTGVGELAKFYVEEIPNSVAYVCDPKIHTEVCENPYMRIMEFFAKNIGIRRSKSPWILSTNADVILSCEWFDILAKMDKLKGLTLYRTAYRTDLRSDLEYTHVEEAERKSNWLSTLRTVPPLYSQAAGDFQLASRKWWLALRGFDETIRWAKIHKDRRLCSQTLKHKGKIVAIGRCFHVHHFDSYSTMKNRYAWTSHNGPEYNVEAGLPYRNSDSWGLVECRETKLTSKVFLLDLKKTSARPPTRRLVVPLKYWKKGYESKYGYPKGGRG